MEALCAAALPCALRERSFLIFARLVPTLTSPSGGGAPRGFGVRGGAQGGAPQLTESFMWVLPGSIVSRAANEVNTMPCLCGDFVFCVSQIQEEKMKGEKLRLSQRQLRTRRDPAVHLWVTRGAVGRPPGHRLEPQSPAEPPPPEALVRVGTNLAKITNKRPALARGSATAPHLCAFAAQRSLSGASREALPVARRR